jgi:hypothetical protein
MIDDIYKVDHLFLLIGKNTLPNYVAAKLLLRDPSQSRLVLIYSNGTHEERLRLEDTLRAEVFRSFENVPVEESNPTNIENEIRLKAKGLTGKIGLNYTGGTKAMSVYAYRELSKLPDVQFSYLDARTLSLVISGSVSTTLSVGTLVAVPLRVLLGLHSRKLSFKPDPLWSQTAQAIAKLHANDESRKTWHGWIAQTFFKEPQWPQFKGPQFDEQKPTERDVEWQQWVRELCVWKTYKQRNWVNKTHLKNVELSTLSTFSTVHAALLQETGLSESDYFCGDKGSPGLMQKGQFTDADKLGKWFEGEWLDSYVLQQVKHIQDENRYNITEAGNDLKPQGTQEAQIDVAFTRGYQLFALSCTSSEEKGLCKSKLLEVVVRAEQLGGAEARSALICCYDKPQELQQEVTDLCGANVRVFGRDDLLNIQTCLENWISDVSGQRG